MRLVLDTNVVVSGFLWRSHPYRLLDFAREQKVYLYSSAALLDELADVLARDHLIGALAANRTTADFLTYRYGMLATRVVPKFADPTVVRDPDDGHVLACASAAGADLVVSGDKDLLVIEEFQGIRVVTPAVAVRLVESGHR